MGAVLYYHESDEFCDTSGRKEEAKLSKLEYKKSEFIEDKSYPTMFVPAQKAGLLRVGIIGVGGFAKVKLLPILSELKQTKLDAIVDVNTANALTVARQYKAAHVLADDQELFENDLIDVAVIASPHLFHADQALRALKSGKAVFLEKPMVTNIEQLNEFKKLFENSQNHLLCVDYNRSFSPFMQKIKKVIQTRETPLVIYYRMNAGYIPAEHWVQTDVGAGRIIGEACHIFDLFNFLTDSQPLAVSVEAIHGAKNALFPTDNFSTQIKYADGSICTLLYTALGNTKVGKERMELFFDSKTIIMDDYKILTGYGVGPLFDKTLTPDKGHAQLLTTFFDRIKQPIFVPPIEYSRLLTTAQLSLMVDQLACAGGGECTV